MDSVCRETLTVLLPTPHSLHRPTSRCGVVEYDTLKAIHLHCTGVFELKRALGLTQKGSFSLQLS